MQRDIPETVEIVAQLLQTGGVEAVDPAIPHRHVVHQSRVLQHLEVLGHCRPAYWKECGQLPNGSRPVGEVLQDGTACRVAEGVDTGP